MHPGGKGVILELAGCGVTQAFDGAGHSNNARTILNRYYLGTRHRTLDDYIPVNLPTSIEKLDSLQLDPIFSAEWKQTRSYLT